MGAFGTMNYSEHRLLLHFRTKTSVDFTKTSSGQSRTEEQQREKKFAMWYETRECFAGNRDELAWRRAWQQQQQQRRCGGGGSAAGEWHINRQPQGCAIQHIADYSGGSSSSFSRYRQGGRVEAGSDDGGRDGTSAVTVWRLQAMPLAVN